VESCDPVFSLDALEEDFVDMKDNLFFVLFFMVLQREEHNAGFSLFRDVASAGGWGERAELSNFGSGELEIGEF